MLLMTNANLDGMRVDQETWAQQLKDAMNVNGGDVENATAGDYVMHFLTFGFKVCMPLFIYIFKKFSINMLCLYIFIAYTKTSFWSISNCSFMNVTW